MSTYFATPYGGAVHLRADCSAIATARTVRLFNELPRKRTVCAFCIRRKELGERMASWAARRKA